nr:MAG TPA: hypothetical protein [Caudoviricetes sp.]
MRREGNVSSLPTFRAFGREPANHAHQSPSIIKERKPSWWY